MTATYVTVAELRANLGIGSLYSDDSLEEVCQAAEDLVKSSLWFNSYPVVGVSTYQKTSTVVLSASATFAAGQTVTISDCGSIYNGTHVIKSTYPWTAGSGTFPFFAYYPFNGLNFPYGYSMFSFDNDVDDDKYHLVVPYGVTSITDPTLATDYAAKPAVRKAALEVAVDIFQSQKESNAGGISPDFSPSPYRMGNTLMARVRGLLAPYQSPRGQVG
jgi:hypothetical protein